MNTNGGGGGTTLPGARVSRQTLIDKGWLPPEKILKKGSFKKVIACMVFKLLCMLEMSFPSFISQIPEKFRYLEQFWLMFYWKSAIMRLKNVYDLIVMSYVGCLLWFWYVDYAGCASGKTPFLTGLYAMTPYLKATDYLLLDDPLLEMLNTHWPLFISKSCTQWPPFFFISKTCTQWPPFLFQRHRLKKKHLIKFMFNWR